MVFQIISDAKKLHDIATTNSYRLLGKSFSFSNPKKEGEEAEESKIYGIIVGVEQSLSNPKDVALHVSTKLMYDLPIKMLTFEDGKWYVCLYPFNPYEEDDAYIPVEKKDKDDDSVPHMYDGDLEVYV